MAHGDRRERRRVERREQRHVKQGVRAKRSRRAQFYEFPSRVARVHDYRRFAKVILEWYEGSGSSPGMSLHPDFETVTMEDWAKALTHGRTPSGERGE